MITPIQKNTVSMFWSSPRLRYANTAIVLAIFLFCGYRRVYAGNTVAIAQDKALLDTQTAFNQAQKLGHLVTTDQSGVFRLNLTTNTTDTSNGSTDSLTHHLAGMMGYTPELTHAVLNSRRALQEAGIGVVSLFKIKRDAAELAHIHRRFLNGALPKPPGDQQQELAQALSLRTVSLDELIVPDIDLGMIILDGKMWSNLAHMDAVRYGNGLVPNDGDKAFGDSELYEISGRQLNRRISPRADRTSAVYHALNNILGQHLQLVNPSAIIPAKSRKNIREVFGSETPVITHGALRTQGRVSQVITKRELVLAPHGVFVIDTPTEKTANSGTLFYNNLLRLLYSSELQDNLSHFVPPKPGTTDHVYQQLIGPRIGTHSKKELESMKIPFVDDSGQVLFLSREDYVTALHQGKAPLSTSRHEMDKMLNGPVITGMGGSKRLNIAGKKAR